MHITISSISDLPSYKNVGFTHIISLLDDGYTAVLENGLFLPTIVGTGDHLFEEYLPHQRLERQFDDVSYPNQYYMAPTREDVEAILEFAKSFNDESRVLVHCVAGISRSTAAASLVMMQAHPNMTAAEVFTEIVRIRPQAVPNILMLKHGGHILDRYNEIADAYRDRFSAVR
jgi:predicted protein tyrosine phosphatase